MTTKTKIELVRMSARIPVALQEKLAQKVYSIKSRNTDFTIEQAVKEALEDWLKKVGK